MTLTEKLNILMAERGMTRGTLAECTGIPYNTIVGFYTKGYRNMKLSNLKRIGAYFGVSLDMLCDDDRDLETPPAQPTADRYQALSRKGRALVDTLIEGLADLEQPEQEQEAPVEYLREFLTPAAAGYASPVLNEDYTLIQRTPDVPRDADYAVRISGDSMEPYIADGARVYVSRTNALADGDVGIFFVDGDMKCKQFCQDSFGNIYLFSLNRARQDADVHVPASSGVTVFCFGRVLLKRRPPLPQR